MASVRPLAWLPEVPRYYARGLVRELMTKDIFLWAQAIAFKVLVTLVPVVVLATGVVGQVLRRDRPFEVVAGFVQEFLPPYQSAKFIELLQGLQAASGTITLVGVVGLFLAAVSLLTTLRAVVSNAFREDYHKARSIPRGYLFDARMVLQVGLLFALIFALTLVTESVNRAGAGALGAVGVEAEWLRSGWAALFRLVGLLVPFGLAVGMFAQLYYFVPTPHPPRGSAVRGALFAATLWEVAKRAFTLYAAGSTRFDLSSTFGLVLALVLWIYYSGLVLCLGALVVLLSEKRRRAAAGLDTRPADRPVPHPAPVR